MKDLLRRVESVPISGRDLAHVVSIDDGGSEVTVRDLLAENSPRVLAAFGPAAAPAPVRKPARSHVKSVSRLNQREVRRVVEAFLDAIPRGRAVGIVGRGSFTVSQLRDELKKQTEIGKRLTEMVLQHNRFMEEAIKQGKVHKKTSNKVKLPDFDF